MGTWLSAVARGVSVAWIAMGLAACGGGSSSAPPAGQAPVIQSFSASPSWVTSGDSATLKWSVSGATSLSVDSLGPVTGSSALVTAAADTTYVLTASNPFGSTRAQATVAVFPPPKTWFAPFPPNLWPNYGSYDYVDLFSPTAAWTTAAGHLQVFKLYPYTLSLADADLKNLFADLKRRHIAVGLEQGGLMPVASSSCSGDFDGVNAIRYVQHIRDLGGSLQYVALDEPFYSAVLDNGATPCHWTIQQTVDNVATTVAAMRSVFPDLVVGDIEPVAAADSNNAAYEQWIDAWQVTTGKPFAFFHFDVAWGSDWQPAVMALSRALRARHIPYGQIYIGAGDVTTDDAWVGATEQEMTDFETHGNPTPDQVIFQSWDPLPHHVLPESDPGSFTYLIDRYFRARTQLTLAASAGVASGEVTGPSGPLGNASVALTAVPLTGPGQPSAYTYSGTVPPGAQYLVFGARVALENCSSVTLPAEFYLTDFTLDAGAAGQIHADFTNQLNGWGLWGNASIAQVEQSSLHVQVTPGETMGLNSDSLPFAAAGAAYRFTVNAMIPLGSRGDGCVIAVFQDGSFQELSRAVMQIVPLPITLASLQTDSGGAFAFNLAPQPAPFELWADYAGSSTLWPAAAAVGVGTGPALAITTTALPDATAGSAYTQTLGVSGGRAPYLWAAGPLPPGLVLQQNGTLSGTPATAGTWTISLSVVDDSAPAEVVDLSLQLIVH